MRENLTFVKIVKLGFHHRAAIARTWLRLFNVVYRKRRANLKKNMATMNKNFCIEWWSELTNG
jgi:hypothetical protein